MDDIGFQPGDVVICYPGEPQQATGVVRAFEPRSGLYRVRISTISDTDFVEYGVRRADMRYAPAEAALDWL